jgi:hypothetical protein
MAEIKTKATDAPVADFINAIPDAQTRQDCWTLVEIMQEASKAPARMWGSSIVGFGQYRATYANGKGVDWMLIGFSPRKQALTLYILMGGVEHSEQTLARLGKHTRGKGCLYVRHLSDIDLTTLKEMVRASVDYMHKNHPVTGD